MNKKSSPLLKTINLKVGYKAAKSTLKNHMVLEQLNLEINSGEMICLMGANGCGKSTLLRTLSCLMPKLAGQILLAGKSLDQFLPHQLARKISVVLTEKLDLQNFTVEEVVALGRFPYTNFFGTLTQLDQIKIEEALLTLDLCSLRKLIFNQLSDGQKQKVLIAKGLAQDTALLLLDEPTTFLDISGKMEVLQLLKNITIDKKIATLFSSHDWELVLGMANKVWLVTQDGNIITGTPEDLILNGQFAACFAHDKFYFNKQLGIFKEKKIRQGKKILINGDNKIKNYWTAHALEKEGHQIVSSNDQLPSLRISVLANSWRLEQNSKSLIYSSLAQLLATI